MRIGILTQPLLTNYGGLLQNFAMQQILKKNGYEAITIDWLEYNYFSKSFLRKKWLKTYVLSQFNCLFPGWHFMTPAEYKVATQNIDKFKEERINKTRKYQKSVELLGIDTREQLDAFIVGSDQCWRPSYNRSFLRSMFLEFLSPDFKGKRIAYAVSFGTDGWEYSDEETKICGDLARKFDLITTRELSGVELCKNHFKVNATKVQDPTMLLTAEDYLSMFDVNLCNHNKGILTTYILDENNNIKQQIKAIMEKTQLTQRHELRAKLWSEHDFRSKFNIADFTCISVADWLSHIYNAEMVLTNSFHGMVFSILFNKPFWVIGNEGRGLSRFESLLQDLKLEDRIIKTENLDTLDLKKKIEWNSVNQILQEKRDFSKKLLFDTLED